MMATSTELLRAAEHMLAAARDPASGCFPGGKQRRAYLSAARSIEREAKRLQSVEAQHPKRSWPEGWPPFAVLRRVYESIDSNPWPSVKWCERPGADWRDAAAARRVRREWVRALDDRGISNPSSP